MGGLGSWTKQARRPSNEVGSSRGVGLRVTPLWPKPAPERAEPVLVWPHLVLAPEAVGYVCRDARLREAIYRATCGSAGAWPIPLTYCKTPA